MRLIFNLFFAILLLFATITTEAQTYNESLKKIFENAINQEELLRTYEEHKKVYDKIDACSVSILNVNPSIGLCSGTVIKNTWDESIVLTAKHCISMNEETYVEDVLVDYVIVDSEDDLALLISNSKIRRKTVAKLKVVNAWTEDIVYHVGFPSIYKTYRTKGKIVRYTKDWGYVGMFIKQGCSGGGLFNKHGELIGVVWGKLMNESVGLFEPIQDVQKFLDRVKIK